MHTWYDQQSSNRFKSNLNYLFKHHNKQTILTTEIKTKFKFYLQEHFEPMIHTELYIQLCYSIRILRIIKKIQSTIECQKKKKKIEIER